MTFQDVLALLSAVGAGGALGKLIESGAAIRSGKAQQEKEANQELAAQRDRAWQLVEQERARADRAENEANAARLKADAEVAKAHRDAEQDIRTANVAKRRAMELASRYRRRLVEAGGDPGEWPQGLE